MLTTGTFRDSQTNFRNPTGPSNVGVFSFKSNGYSSSVDLSARDNCPELINTDGSVFRPAYVQATNFDAGFKVAPELGANRFVGGIVIRNTPKIPCDSNPFGLNINLGINLASVGISGPSDGFQFVDLGICGCWGGFGFPLGYWETVSTNTGVPTPSSLCLLMLGLLGYPLRLHQRKRTEI